METSVAIDAASAPVGSPFPDTSGQLDTGTAYERSLACVPSDLDANGDVDGSDFKTFAACFNGTGNPVSPPARPPT